MLYALFTCRFCIPVNLTNYINQHKKSTGFRDIPIVFKNRKPASQNQGTPLDPETIHGVALPHWKEPGQNRILRRPFCKNIRHNNHIIFSKKQYFYKNSLFFIGKFFLNDEKPIFIRYPSLILSNFCN